MWVWHCVYTYVIVCGCVSVQIYMVLYGCVIFICMDIYMCMCMPYCACDHPRQLTGINSFILPCGF